MQARLLRLVWILVDSLPHQLPVDCVGEIVFEEALQRGSFLHLTFSAGGESANGSPGPEQGSAKGPLTSNVVVQYFHFPRMVAVNSFLFVCFKRWVWFLSNQWAALGDPTFWARHSSLGTLAE